MFILVLNICFIGLGLSAVPASICEYLFATSARKHSPFSEWLWQFASGNQSIFERNAFSIKRAELPLVNVARHL